MPDDTDPLVRSFQLVGLHGYKNIRLDFQRQAKIVIAENGAGETIFLSALAAFLTRNFFKLSTLQFDRLERELAGQSAPLILHRGQLPTTNDEEQSGLRELVNYARADASDVRDAILRYDGGDISETQIFHRVWANSPWSVEETADRIRQLHTVLAGPQSDELKYITSTLKTVLCTIEVLYLPTYRRIELSISKRDDRRIADQAAWMRSIAALDEPFEERQSTLGINYGLADVEARLRRLTELIQQRSNIGYREISAAIIDDLLAGRFASGDWRSRLFRR